MKKRFSLALLFTSLMCLSGCGEAPAQEHKEIDFSQVEANEYTPEKNTGNLSNFGLISPTDGAEVIHVPTFTWEACQNAERYTLEICESDQFVSTVDYIVYYKLENITTTSFNIQADLANKNTMYYWRVSASNSLIQDLRSDDVFSFYLKAEEKEEVQFDLGDADDWTLHEVGSYADVSIDNSNFFGNNKPSLAITFKKEDTNQGIPSSDGWLIVTKTVEKSIYGTDALYLNVFYAGNDSRLLIRVVDKDNEYWFAEVMLSNNAKQQVILKFSDFVQRYNDVPVANEQFDYERIKYMEVVFEKTFGDGVCLISDVKAIKYENYKDMFIDKLHFDEYAEEAWTNETYAFTRTINGDEATFAFGGDTNINGYGFAKLNANRFFGSGDAIKFKVKYTGSKGNNIIFRIYEEDQDRWLFKIPYSKLTEDEYREFVVPFKAFGKSQFEGDGKRQFSFILNLQFGVDNQYGTGSFSFADFELVKLANYKTEETRVVGNDGIIDNFEQYSDSTDMYLIWDVTDVNKDEFMTLNSDKKARMAGNTQCAQFEYKADMETAAYTLPLTVESSDFNALSLMLKDASTPGKNAKVDVYLQLDNNAKYVHTFDALIEYWTEYNIPFDQFKLTNPEEVIGAATGISSNNIVGLGIALQYFNVKPDGTGIPLYTDGNIVYVDNIKLTNNGTYAETQREDIISIVDGIGMIEDAETYSSTTDLLDKWMINSSNGYEDLQLSNEVSAEGGNNSIMMQYKTNENSISYGILTTISSDTSCRGLRISLKGDDKATIYINVYLTINGNVSQYRATLTSIASSWTEYSLGWQNFVNVNNPQQSGFTNNYVPYITKITIGAVDWNGADGHNLSTFYMDNLYFDSSLAYGTNTIRTIA